jgi:hypothetical protein
LSRLYFGRFSDVHIGGSSSNQAATLESQMIHPIQLLPGRTLKLLRTICGRLRTTLRRWNPSSWRDGNVLGLNMTADMLVTRQILPRSWMLSAKYHVILDNYATHKHPAVMRWLDRHPRFTFHFTPTSGSWINCQRMWLFRLSAAPMLQTFIVT